MQNPNILVDDVDGESDWYYYEPFGDHAWWIIKNDWLTCCKQKYFEHLKEKRVMVTCGAHVGLYARFFAKEFGTVYAFEPDPFNFLCLVNNCRTDNVIKLQAAAGNTRKLINLSMGPHHLTKYVSSDETNAIIPVLRIDDLNLPICDLIQMDIENYEYEALLGAKETILRCSPVIIAENGEVETIVDFLESLDYEIVDRTNWDTIWRKKSEQV